MIYEFIENVALVGWIPLVLFFFARFKPQHAVIFAIVGGWLFLPPNPGAYIKIIEGIPVYAKLNAPGIAICLAILVFDFPRLFTLRPRLPDCAMLAWCLCPIPSSMVNGYGIYDGLAVSYQQFFLWGAPYLAGRLYFTDLAALRELAGAILLGALIYLPLCLVERRMGPGFWQTMVYGRVSLVWWEVFRFGSVRPMVFMSHGLMTALWMCAGALIAIWLWLTSTIRTLWGYPFIYYVIAASLGALLCVSLGALMIFAGVLVIVLCFRYWPSRLILIVLLTTAPVYMTLRTLGVWSGDNMVDLASRIDTNRAASLDARRGQEEDNIATAKAHLAFGVATHGPGADQLWLLAFRNHGLTGLCAMTLTLLLPIVAFCRACPPRHWRHPWVAPAAILPFVVLMFLFDGLFNYMYNPVYLLAAGGLAAIKSVSASQPRLAALSTSAGTPGVKAWTAAGSPPPKPVI